MLLIPAIDLKDGQCVRLKQGRMEDNTVFSDDPVAMAEQWVKLGAKRMHLVDLNGAFAGEPVNREAIQSIANAFPDLILQVGGGIRNESTIEAYLNIGVDYCIIGTQAVKKPEFVLDACETFPEQILVGLDAQDGKVAINGWAEITDMDVLDVAYRLESDGVAAIIYTDISRDGMMQGCNIEATTILANAVQVPIIASGGISRLDDLKALCQAKTDNIIGAITGRAIYEGQLDFAAGQRLLERC